MSKLMINCVIFGILMQAYIITAGRPDFVTDEMLEMVADDKARCMSEHGTTEELIERVGNGDIVNDPAITCYMFCLFESFSAVDDDGVLEADMLLGFFPDDIQAKGGDVLHKCSVQNGADNCEKMFNIGKCIYSQVPEMWFMI